MNLEPDPIAESLRAAVRGRLRVAATASPDAADGWARGCPAAEEATWAALRGLTACALDAPVEAGGLELGLTASATVAEELGRAALPTGYLAVAAAIDAASAADRGAPAAADLAAGDTPVSFAGFEAGAPVRAVADGQTLVLHGTVPVDAPGGETAPGDPTAGPGCRGALLLPARLATGTGLLLLTPADLAGVAARAAPQPSGAAGLVMLDGVRLPRRALLHQLAEPDPVLARARVRQAGYLYGLARGVLAAGVGYASTRRQFDRPLREFQSVAFRLAAGYVEVEALRLVVARAVWLADTGQPNAGQAAEALAQAAETATATVRMVAQVCGVRAMTAQLPVHRYYLRARREAARLGRPGELWRQSGRQRLREGLKSVA